MSETERCRHKAWERDFAAVDDGRCPLCLSVKIERLAAERDEWRNVADTRSAEVETWMRDAMKAHTALAEVHQVLRACQPYLVHLELTLLQGTRGWETLVELLTRVAATLAQEKDDE